MSMGIQQAFVTCLKKYADFSGRATRSEYWWFVLCEVLILGIASLISDTLPGLFALALVLPALGLAGVAGWALRLDRAAVKALRITDLYSLHRVVYDLFEDVRTAAQKQASEPSGIQWADKGGEQHYRQILLLSDRQPKAGEHGEVESRPLPEGFGVDRHGQPTTDPRAVLDGGALLPFGGLHSSYKGSALSMMVELLAAALTGGHFSFEFDWSGHPGAHTPHTGELIIAIDPAKNQGRDFAQRCEDLVRAMAGAGQQRLPGERRYRQRAQSLREGVALPAATWAELQRLAQA